MTLTRQRSALRLLVVVVALLTVAGAGVAPLAAAQDDGPPTPPHRFYGTVADDGSPVSGATVQVVYQGTVLASDTTNGDGYYDLKAAPEGTSLSEGDSVTLRVSGTEKTETWKPAGATEVDFDVDTQTETPPSDTPTTTATTTRSGGGGGGGGGGGAVDRDPFPGTSPVASDSALLVRTENAEVEISGDGASVSRVAVTFGGKVDGTVEVTELAGTPDHKAFPSDLILVSVVDISVPDEATDSVATVSMTVAQSRLDDVGVAAEDLVVYHYDGGWQALDTSVAESGDGTVTLEAETPGFSVFAVGAAAQQTTEQTTQTTEQTTEQTSQATTEQTTQTTQTTEQTTGQTTTSSNPLPGFGVTVALVALVALALLAVRRD